MVSAQDMARAHSTCGNSYGCTLDMTISHMQQARTHIQDVLCVNTTNSAPPSTFIAWRTACGVPQVSATAFKIRRVVWL